MEPPVSTLYPFGDSGPQLDGQMGPQAPSRIRALGQSAWDWEAAPVGSQRWLLLCCALPEADSPCKVDPGSFLQMGSRGSQVPRDAQHQRRHRMELFTKRQSAAVLPVFDYKIKFILHERRGSLVSCPLPSIDACLAALCVWPQPPTGTRGPGMGRHLPSLPRAWAGSEQEGGRSVCPGGRGVGTQGKSR